MEETKFENASREYADLGYLIISTPNKRKIGSILDSDAGPDGLKGVKLRIIAKADNKDRSLVEVEPGFTYLYRCEVLD